MQMTPDVGPPLARADSPDAGMAMGCPLPSHVLRDVGVRGVYNVVP